MLKGYITDVYQGNYFIFIKSSVRNHKKESVMVTAILEITQDALHIVAA